MNARNEGLKVALNNIADSKNMLAVAESGLQSISNILTEMKSKATSAASDTLGTEERAAIQSQLQSLARQINDIVDETEWNGTLPLDGTVNKSLQIGAGGSDTTAWTLSQNHDSVHLGVASGSATGALVYASGGTYQLNQGGQTGYDSSVVMDAFGANSTHGVIETLDSFDGLSELESGTYKFTLATEKASLATQAYAVVSNGPTALGTFTGIAGGNATYELDSGMYTFEIWSYH